MEFHSPRNVHIGGRDNFEVKQVCNACEVNWWPCLTYKLATGEVEGDLVPEPDPRPFGHTVTPPRFD